MKLLQVISGDLWAGAEVQFFYLCRQLSASGVDVHAVLFNEGVLAERLRASGVPVRVFDETQLGGAQLFRKLLNYLQELSPTLIHTHGHKENILVGIANAFTIRVPSLRTVHGSNEIHEPLWKVHKHAIHWLNIWVGQFLQQAVVAVSYPLAEELARWYPAQKLRVIENAIDTIYVERLAQHPASYRVTDSIFNIAIVGRLVSVKRQDLLLQAIAVLRSRLPQLHLHIIGEGPLRSGLEQLCEQLTLCDFVTFTGALDPVYPVLAQMDLLVMPSDHEGLPMTLLEAMALQIPVAAHAVGGILRVTQNGALALLVNEHTALGYATAISQVLDNVEASKQRAAKAHEQVKQHYDIASKQFEYISLYKSLSTKEHSFTV